MTDETVESLFRYIIINLIDVWLSCKINKRLLIVFYISWTSSFFTGN